MYLITLYIDGTKLELKTEKRSLARAIQLLADENNIVSSVFVESKPRTVKFKGIAAKESEA